MGSIYVIKYRCYYDFVDLGKSVRLGVGWPAKSKRDIWKQSDVLCSGMSPFPKEYTLCETPLKVP